MLSQSTIVKFVLLGICFFGSGVVILNFLSYGRHESDSELMEKDNLFAGSYRNYDARSNKKNTKLNKHSANFALKFKDIGQIAIRTYKIALNNEAPENILVRESGDDENHILLLHGREHTSDVWLNVSTLQYLSSWGYHAYAIDIPRSGNNSLPVVGNRAAAVWLQALINTLRLSNLVIISEGISARLVLPYMIQSRKDYTTNRGFVFIAPIAMNQYQPIHYQGIKLPTLVVHGENDTESRSSVETLTQITSSELLMMKSAGRYSYLDQPKEFHKALRKFLDKIYQTTSLKSSKKKSSLKAAKRRHKT